MSKTFLLQAIQFDQSWMVPSIAMYYLQLNQTSNMFLHTVKYKKQFYFKQFGLA